MLIGLLGYFLVWDRKHERKWNWNRLRYQASAMAEIFRIGFPAALQMTFEVGVFAVSTTLAASLNATDLAAHQIVLNTASLTFTIPLGVGAATAVLVGQALGKKEWQTATRVGWRGFGLGVSFMAFSCLVLLGFSESILRFFTQDEGILLVGRSILFVAALFQLSDGIQTVGTGALRGLGDTQSAMYCNLCGHWLVGLPLGALLCFRWGWGLRGIWIGLSLGLTVVAAGILIQWWRKSRKLQFLQ
jgi:MATE family multidrug resistance protein